MRYWAVSVMEKLSRLLSRRHLVLHTWTDTMALDRWVLYAFWSCHHGYWSLTQKDSYKIKLNYVLWVAMGSLIAMEALFPAILYSTLLTWGAWRLGKAIYGSTPGVIMQNNAIMWLMISCDRSVYIIDCCRWLEHSVWTLQWRRPRRWALDGSLAQVRKIPIVFFFAAWSYNIGTFQGRLVHKN